MHWPRTRVHSRARDPSIERLPSRRSVDVGLITLATVFSLWLGWELINVICGADRWGADVGNSSIDSSSVYRFWPVKFAAAFESCVYSCNVIVDVHVRLLDLQLLVFQMSQDESGCRELLAPLSATQASGCKPLPAADGRSAALFLADCPTQESSTHKIQSEHSNEQKRWNHN